MMNGFAKEEWRLAIEAGFARSGKFCHAEFVKEEGRLKGRLTLDGGFVTEGRSVGEGFAVQGGFEKEGKERGLKYIFLN